MDFWLLLMTEEAWDFRGEINSDKMHDKISFDDLLQKDGN